MDWLSHLLTQNNSVVALGLTALFSIVGAKKVVGRKINIIFTLLKESLDVLLVLTKALRPDVDGKVRIDSKELQEIQKELADMKKALGNILALR